jgi:hypothetical protein
VTAASATLLLVWFMPARNRFERLGRGDHTTNTPPEPLWKRSLLILVGLLSAGDAAHEVRRAAP